MMDGCGSGKGWTMTKSAAVRASARRAVAVTSPPSVAWAPQQIALAGPASVLRPRFLVARLGSASRRGARLGYARGAPSARSWQVHDQLVSPAGRRPIRPGLDARSAVRLHAHALRREPRWCDAD